MESPRDIGDDERLRELLAVERRLQDFVRAAQEERAGRIAAAKTAREQRLITALRTAELADAEQARAEQVEHERALAAIEAAHQTAIAAITSLSDERVEELARWALVQAITGDGEPA